MFKEFKAFVLRGNVLDMAVGIIIGGAFGTIVKSLVEDVLMPPLGVMLGGVDFSNFFFVLKDGSRAGPYATLEAARAAGAVVVGYGKFLNNVISFLIVSAAVFLLVQAVHRVRALSELHAVPTAPTTKECPRCRSTIHVEATRCPACTADL